MLYLILVAVAGLLSLAWFVHHRAVDADPGKSIVAFQQRLEALENVPKSEGRL